MEVTGVAGNLGTGIVPRLNWREIYAGQSTKEQKFGYILQVIKLIELKKLDGLLAGLDLFKLAIILNWLKKIHSKGLTAATSVAAFCLGLHFVKIMRFATKDHALCSRDHPPMLAPGRYPQWRSRFLRYVDTRPNSKPLRKCILSGHYKPTTVLVHDVEATDDSLAVLEHTTVETPTNMSPKNKAHFLAENEAIHLILTGIGDDIYSTVDACQIALEMWEAIESLQQVTTRQVNVQFLQQLQPEWSRFVTIVKQHHKLDEVSYHKLFDILKQYQNEVNELRAEKLARNANPLALVATAQASQDQYYQTSRSHRSSAPSPKPSIPSRSQTTTRHKGKEIAKPITPPSETSSEEDSDPEQAQRDKDIQKNLALIAKYFKKIYKPTNNNLRTSSNSKNKNVDMTPRYKNNDHFGQFGTQRTVNVAGTREKEVPTADSGTDLEPVEQVQNDAGYNVFTNHLQHYEQFESISNTCLVKTDDSNVTPDSPDICEDDIQNEQNDVVSDDERVALVNLIANLKLDAEFEKFKAFNDRTIDHDKLEHLFRAPTAPDMDILIQTCLMPLAIKTQSDSLKFVHELKQEMHDDLKYVESLEKKIDEVASDKAEFLDMYDVIL
nr:hypothetical protein [Tanacetum cinerariifolium]